MDGSGSQGCYERYYAGALSQEPCQSSPTLAHSLGRPAANTLPSAPYHTQRPFPLLSPRVLCVLTHPHLISLPSVSGAEHPTVSQERAGFPCGHSAQPPSSRSDSRTLGSLDCSTCSSSQTSAFRSALTVVALPALGFVNGPLEPPLASRGCDPGRPL